MSICKPSRQNAQAGFTLVELAIVMIIIGLLIAGVLKGQQLIGNARVTSQVAQIKAIDGAVSSFRDMYNATPGDLATATTRLANCTGGCANAPAATAGNNRIDITPATAPTTANEAGLFFPQLAAADLITGINYSAASVANWGTQLPAARIGGGGIQPGGSTGLAADFTNPLSTAANPPSAGLYLTLTANPGAVPAAILTPNQAQRIDTRIDDGIPGSGSAIAGGAATCGSATVYTETQTANTCVLYVRIQG